MVKYSRRDFQTDFCQRNLFLSDSVTETERGRTRGSCNLERWSHVKLLK